MAVSVAVVGATGAVGELMRKVLLERDFPVGSIKFLASERMPAKPIEFGGKRYPVEPIRPGGVRRRRDRPLQHAGDDQPRVQPDRRQGRGRSSSTTPRAWRMDPDVPAGRARGERRRAARTSRRGSSPTRTASAIPLCVALKPLHDLGASQARRRRPRTSRRPARGRRAWSDFERSLAAWPRASRCRRRRPTRRSWPATSSPTTGPSTRTATPRKRTRSSTRRGRSSATTSIHGVARRACACR